MRRTAAVLLFALLVLSSPACRPARATPVLRPIRVLFVGNSLTYTNDLPHLVEQIAAALDLTPIETTFTGAGGLTFRDQALRDETLRAIRNGHYDWVVLQAQSTEVLRDEGSLYYAKRLDAEIRENGARTLIFLTWAIRAFPIPQAAYTVKYQAIAHELKAPIVPVGIAWQTARNHGVDLFADGTHPNHAGSYLAACVFVAALEHRSPEGAYQRMKHLDIPAASAATLEHDAWTTVTSWHD